METLLIRVWEYHHNYQKQMKDLQERGWDFKLQNIWISFYLKSSHSLMFLMFILGWNTESKDRGFILCQVDGIQVVITDCEKKKSLNFSHLGLYCFQALNAKGPKEFFFFPANLSEDSRWGEQEKAELLWENKTKQNQKHIQILRKILKILEA